MGVKIKKEEKVISQYLDTILTFINPDKRISGENIFNFDWYLYAISHRIEITDKKIDERRKFYILNKAIKNLVGQPEINIEIFKKNLESEIKNYVTKKQQGFFLIVPTPIIHESTHTRFFTVRKTKITLKSGRQVKKEFDFECDAVRKEKYQNPEIDNIEPNHTCFIIKGYAPDVYSFSETSLDLFDELKSAINFAENYRSIPYMSPKDSLSLLRYPKYIFIFNDDKKCLQFNKYINNQTTTSEINFDKGRLKGRKVIPGTKKTLTQINAIPNERIKEWFILALKLHNSALDHYSEYALCCFNLWQILEILLMANNLGRDKIISLRILPFLGSVEPFYDMIQEFADKRNKLVHEANYQIYSDRDISTMKELVEFFMLQFLNKAKRFKSLEQLQLYYESCDYYFKGFKPYNNSANQEIGLKRKTLKDLDKSYLVKNIPQ